MFHFPRWNGHFRRFPLTGTIFGWSVCICGDFIFWNVGHWMTNGKNWKFVDGIFAHNIRILQVNCILNAMAELNELKLCKPNLKRFSLKKKIKIFISFVRSFFLQFLKNTIDFFATTKDCDVIQKNGECDVKIWLPRETVRAV